MKNRGDRSRENQTPSNGALQHAQPPAILTELHAMTWRMHAERVEKLQTQMALLQSQQQTIHAQQQLAISQLDSHKAMMRMVYGLTDADSINLETGLIIRAAPVTLQDAEGKA